MSGEGGGGYRAKGGRREGDTEEARKGRRKADGEMLVVLTV